MYFLQSVVCILGLGQRGLGRAKRVLHGGRGYSGQLLPFAHTATLFHINVFQQAAIFECQVNRLAFLEVAGIGVVDDVFSRGDIKDAYRDDPFLSSPAKEPFLELLRVGVGTACNQQHDEYQ